MQRLCYKDLDLSLWMKETKKLYLKKCRAIGLNFKLCVLNLLMTRTKNKRRETKCHHIQVVTSKKKKKK